MIFNVADPVRSFLPRVLVTLVRLDRQTAVTLLYTMYHEFPFLTGSKVSFSVKQKDFRQDNFKNIAETQAKKLLFL